MKKIILVVGLCLVLSGCGTYKMAVISPPDNSDKTITIPAGARGLKGAVKDVMRREGWKIVTDAGPTITKGNAGPSLDVQTFDTFRSRYRMVIDSRQYDICFPGGDPVYFYELAIVDNKTGDEIMTMDGDGCEHIILEMFQEWLDGKVKSQLKTR